MTPEQLAEIVLHIDSAAAGIMGLILAVIVASTWRG